MRGSRPDENELRGLIDEIYEAAMEAACWPGVLGRMAGALGGAHALLQTRNQHLDGAVPIAMVGLDPSLWRDYGTYWAARDLWALAEKPVSPRACRALLFHELVPDRVMERSEMYNDYLRTRGDLFYGIGSWFQIAPDTVAQVGFPMARARGPCDEAHCKTLDALLPHLRRALQITARLGQLDALAGGAMAALDRLRCAVVLLDAHSQVVFMNSAAEMIVRSNDGLVVRERRLVAQDRCRTELARLVDGAIAAALGPGGAAGGALRIERPSGRRSYTLLAVPLRRVNVGPFSGLAGARPVAAVFITDSATEVVPPTGVLHRAFDLTSREAALAQALLAGFSLDEAAARLGLTRESARTYLKRVFAKTGTSRQAELVSMLLRSLTPLS